MAKPKPNPRRDGREAALQFLFSHDLNNKRKAHDSLAEAITVFWDIRENKNKEARKFANQLITGTLENEKPIDLMLGAALENYRMKRLHTIDRNLLRLAIYEIKFSDHIPGKAAINEAIEIAKRFGTDESPKFVNGVLDRIYNAKDPVVEPETEDSESESETEN